MKTFESDRSLEDLALVMTVNCVRNTVIEDYHAAGKISDPEMKAFNKQVANRLFTVLTVLQDQSFVDHRRELLAFLNFAYPDNWDRPAFDWDMVGNRAKQAFGVPPRPGFDQDFLDWQAKNL